MQWIITQQLFFTIIYLKKFVLAVVVALPSYMLKVPNNAYNVYNANDANNVYNANNAYNVYNAITLITSITPITYITP